MNEQPLIAPHELRTSLSISYNFLDTLKDHTGAEINRYRQNILFDAIEKYF